MPEIVSHHLNVHQDARSVKQKKRHIAQERLKCLEEEVGKLEVGFIREIQYPEWLPNVVLVQKASGK